MSKQDVLKPPSWMFDIEGEFMPPDLDLKAEKCLTDDQWAYWWSCWDYRTSSRATGKHGVKFLHTSGDPKQERWVAAIDALIEIGRIDASDRQTALRSEWIKNYKCPNCGSSSGFIRRDKAKSGSKQYDAGQVRVTCSGGRCRTRDVLDVLGIATSADPADLIAWIDKASAGSPSTRVEGDTGQDGTRGSPEGQSAPEALLKPLDVIRASEIVARRVRYLWDRRIPIGAATLMPGEEGIGKTTVGVRIMADVTRGTLPGEYYGQPRDVVILAAEDGLEDVLQPRLAQAGADLERVHIVRARMATDGTGHDVIIPRDLEHIGDVVRRVDAAMVWVDSLVTTLPDDLKSIAYKDTAKVLKALTGWAESCGVAVVAPWHLNKASGTDTGARIMDSRAFRTAVRSMLLVVADPEADEGVTQGIVALDKANAGTLAVPALRYRIRSSPYVVEEVDTDTGEIHEIAASCGVVDWIGEIDGDGRQIARDALAPKVEREGSPQAWLREYLSAAGESDRRDVIAAAEAAGFSEAAMKRASRALRVMSRQETGQVDGRPFKRAMWSLPQSGHQSDHTHPTDRTDPTGEGSIDLTEPIYAGQAQSGQSGQSGPCRKSDPTGARGDPTGESGDAGRSEPGDFYDLPGFADPGPERCSECGNRAGDFHMPSCSRAEEVAS